jgi:signal transduction histidine kinase
VKQVQVVNKFTFNPSEALEIIRQHWLSNLGHSLSGPLFAARGYLRMILAPPQDKSSPNTVRHLNLALENIEHLVVLLQQLADFPTDSKLELAPFRLGAALREALAEVVPQLEGRNITLEQSLPNMTMITAGDADKLRQALRGFISAAAQRVGSPGLIKVAAAESDGRIGVQLTACPVDGIGDPVPDILGPASLWQLHGGTVRAGQTEGCYCIMCELPVIRSLELLR